MGNSSSHTTLPVQDSVARLRMSEPVTAETFRPVPDQGEVKYRYIRDNQANSIIIFEQRVTNQLLREILIELRKENV